MIAHSVNALVIETVENLGNLTILVVSLGEGQHWDAYQAFKRLPAVICYNGQNFGKSCWNSDKNKAYYRNDYAIAFAK